MDVMSISFISRYLLAYGTLRTTKLNKNKNILKAYNIDYESLGEYELKGFSLFKSEKSSYPIANISPKDSIIVELIDLMPKGIRNQKDLLSLYQKNLILDNYENCPNLYKAVRLDCRVSYRAFPDCKIYISSVNDHKWEKIKNYFPDNKTFKILTNDSK